MTRAFMATGKGLAIAALALVLAARCQNPAALTTGLTGVVMRGPIMPVCQDNVPCDAPMQATFEVRRGDRRVTSFQSDAQGRFAVNLPPGTYSVVPTGSGGLMNGQSREVTVGPEGMTAVQLSFDTGIR